MAIELVPIGELRGAWFQARHEASQRLSRYATRGEEGTFFVSSRRVNGRRRYTVRRWEGDKCPNVAGMDCFPSGSMAAAHARRCAESLPACPECAGWTGSLDCPLCSGNGFVEAVDA